ncbi:Nramp family divalent metal transporter [Halobacillus sp. ACCC02827]|uniref:Nramp family divalent metal transporter n=1 Tax=Halobacillus sp. ACCC02827 TaxID=3052090 RepID=UPI002570A8BB|nr:Nramp family divalent metal transporter [Halobacillus sp. ACCC02827]WJE15255.1 Nramp family divalent metal transporter [Halobacillus sp. ACCC02827]
MGKQEVEVREMINDSQSKRLPITELLKRVGPGIILTGVVMGPGVITTASMLGASHGYSLLWLFFPISFMAISFLLATYRITLLTGMPSIHAIRHYYGKFAAAIVGIFAFLSCVFFTIGNISGTGTGMNLLFGINWKFGALIMLCVLVYCYFAKGVYSKVEKGAMICILGMICAFYATLFSTGGPSAAQTMDGLTHWYFPAGSFALALGFISTHASITTGIYGTYLSKEKKWKKEDLFNGAMLADSISHVLGVVLVSGAIVLVGAIVMNPQNILIESPKQMADMLVPFMGRAAGAVMGIALLAAAFSSLLGNTHRSVVLLNAGFNKPTGLEDKSIKWGSIAVLAASAVISFSYGGSPVQLIYLANIATAVAAPAAGFFITLMLFRKDVNKGVKQPRVLQVCMIISYLFGLVLIGLAIVDLVRMLS